MTPEREAKIREYVRMGYDYDIGSGIAELLAERDALRAACQAVWDAWCNSGVMDDPERDGHRELRMVRDALKGTP